MRSKRLLVGAVASAAFGLVLSSPAAAASDNIIVTYAGNGAPGSSGDGGSAIAAELNRPVGVVLDPAGNVFIADTGNNRIRRVTPAGVISTFAGNGVPGDSGDGGSATSAQLHDPTGLAIGRGGDLFIADTGNSRVRKVSPQGVITTVAGRDHGGDQTDAAARSHAQDMSQDCPDQGAGGDGSDVPASRASDGAPPSDHAAPGTAAATQPVKATNVSLRLPIGVAVDGGGNVFIAETGASRVVMVTPDGDIVGVAGTGRPGFSGNTGPATKAALCHPMGVAVTGPDILISDTGNHEVREVRGGTITAFAGTGHSGFGGDGGQAVQAHLDSPVGAAVDPLGDVYIVDAGNARVRQVTPSGVISTFAGTGQAGYGGDSGPAELAKIWPVGEVSVDATNVFFADTGNHRIRRVHKGGPPPALPEGRGLLLVGSGLAVLGGAVVVKRRWSRAVDV